MEKEITLQDAYHYLRQCTGVLVEGRFIEPHVYEIEDDYENEFLILAWEEEYDDEVLDVVVSFNEEDNQKCILDGSSLILVNTDGDEEELTLLREWFPEGK
jgi:hypothetical protein